MNSLIIFAGLFLLATLAIALLAILKRSRKPSAAYLQTKPLTEPEQILYWRLVEALPECVVLSQVTFSRFMKPDTGDRGGDYRALQNKIAQKSADFLVCLKDFTVVGVVELDDTSHVAQKDMERDRMLQSAGIAVLRMQVRDLPSVGTIRDTFTGDAGKRAR